MFFLFTYKNTTIFLFKTDVFSLYTTKGVHNEVMLLPNGNYKKKIQNQEF